MGAAAQLGAAAKVKSGANKADGGANPAVANLDGKDIKTVKGDKIPQEPPAATLKGSKPVKPGDQGSYGDLKAQKRANGETEPLDMDHRPSLAAQVKAAETAKGEPLTKAEIDKLRAESPAVATPRADHQQQSRTYGGRNTEEQIAQDAADLKAAKAKDNDAYKRKRW